MLQLQEKAPYVAKAAKFKTEYTKKLASYNKNQVQLSNLVLYLVSSITEINRLTCIFVADEIVWWRKP